MTIKELKELNRRLTALLDDPQPGLASWCVLLGRTMTDLIDGWTRQPREKL